jgi:hypothetical protein
LARRLDHLLLSKKEKEEGVSSRRATLPGEGAVKKFLEVPWIRGGFNASFIMVSLVFLLEINGTELRIS